MQFHKNGFRPGDPDKCEASDARLKRDPSGSLPEKVDVLIAGCGPAGLCLAAQLALEPEIHTMIVDPKPGPMEKGQADGINVRSMEMFQAFEFAEKVKRESVWINETTFWKPDPENPDRIIRNGRVQDVADGLSEMPHVLLNQARVHDMFLDFMHNAPSRLEPYYNLKVLDLEVDNDAPDYPVTVRLESSNLPDNPATKTLKARYVVGCDGARSNVRAAIGGVLTGDSAHQAWGVMDVLAVTDFPDIRMKSIVQSSHEGNILILPREGGYLVRFYVELDKLNENERVANRDLTVEDIVAAANRILQPYTLDVKEVVWWSIYEIGHRLTDKFDDVVESSSAIQTPRVFTAGDACHTHSPKAGQGMNVSMGDTFNLGWKLRLVLTGKSEAELLHSYSSERRTAAKALIDFDHEWARVVSAPPGETDPEDANIPRFQKHFIDGGPFTAGLTVHYQRSSLTGETTWQNRAPGFEIGKRFHSAPVIRVADAKPMHLGHVIKADARFRLFLFSDDKDIQTEDSRLSKLCAFLEHDASSPILAHTQSGADIDSTIEVIAVFQQEFRQLELADMPPILMPRSGIFGLIDYEKIYCSDLKSKEDIFEMRGIDRRRGCAVIVRPDQHVGHVLPLENHGEIAGYFKGILRTVNGT